MDKQLNILIVDDNVRTLEAIQLELDDRAHVTAVSDPEQAMNLIIHRNFDIVLADYNLGSDDINGLHIFRRAQRKNPYVTACLMTGNQVAPMMKEIFDTFNGLLLEKPFQEGALEELLKRGKENQIRRSEYKEKLPNNDLFADLVAETPSMVKVITQIKKCSKDTDLSIHMAGPTGTGKSTLAEIIHRLSGQKGKLVTVNCAGLEELALSRLFGHVKNAFTGAANDHDGFIKEADGGTLFLDEFHLLSKEVQGKLLQVLHDGKYRRLGDTVDRESHFRLITAASVNVRELAEDGKFSPDLWFRVSGKILDVPSLAERKACIPKLVYRKLAELGKKADTTYWLEPQALDLLASFSWVGNIRDLFNSLQSICSELAPGQGITPELVREELKNRSGNFAATPTKMMLGETLKESCLRYEQTLITQALTEHRWNMVHAAKALGMPRNTLKSRCRILNLYAGPVKRGRKPIEDRIY